MRCCCMWSWSLRCVCVGRVPRIMGRGKSEIPAFANIFSCNFFPGNVRAFFFGMMEWFRILFRVLCSSSLCVVYVFFRGFAYVCCCLRFCFLPFALGLSASVRERVCVF